MKRCLVYIGVAGWSYPDWEGVVYPRAERDKLAFMARFFDLVEINTSFYRPVRPAMSERWVRSVEANPRFRFTAKLWQRFTHQTDEPCSHAEVETYQAGLRPLADAGRLAALLAQFPFYFRDTEPARDLLRRIADQFAPHPLALEVRDASWAEPEALEFLAGLGYSVASLDLPLSRAAFRAWDAVTGPLAYLRLHGRNRDAWFRAGAGRDEKYDYLYDAGEMEQILERIRALQRKAEHLFVVFNNHPHGQAPVNALQTMAALGAEPPAAPDPLRQAYEPLREVTRPEHPGLFD
jgi:uncharacterized protein YecE (DUF72 family)